MTDNIKVIRAGFYGDAWQIIERVTGTYTCPVTGIHEPEGLWITWPALYSSRTAAERVATAHTAAEGAR